MKWVKEHINNFSNKEKQEKYEVILKYSQSNVLMKTEFEARHAYLKRYYRIEEHFLTCFISLLIYRILEKMLGNQFICG